MGTAGDKVVVASKLPFALELQLCDSREEQRQDRATTWVERVYYKTGEIVVINGTSHPRGAPPEGVTWPDPPQTVAGAALTFGVPKAFFDEWMKQNAKTDMVKNGLIFAAAKRDTVVGQAREKKDGLSGFEALRPDATGKDADRRMPKKVINRLPNRGTAEAEAYAE